MKREVLSVYNKEGRKFNVSFVGYGDNYGLGNTLVHEEMEGLVEFYDGTYENKDGFGELGQFVSRYYEGTILDHKNGLTLHGGVDEWSVSRDNIEEIKEWLRK